MPLALGIDLGTSNSMAAISDGRTTRAVSPVDGTFAEGSPHSIPSYVAFDGSGGFDVAGLPAKNRFAEGSGWVVRHMKRLIGRPYHLVEREISEGKRFLSEFDGRVRRADTGGCLLAVPTHGDGEAQHAITDVVAFLISKLVEDARRSGESFDRALVTVPAGFDDNQRQATMAAAEAAADGLAVANPVEEPLAAAVAYGLPEEEATIMVIDMGAGTTDIVVGVISWSDGEPHLEPMHLSCDDELGGLDMDFAILDYLFEYDERVGGAGPPLRELVEQVDPRQRNRLMGAIEKAKVMASEIGEFSLHTVLRTDPASGEALRKTISVQFSLDDLANQVCGHVVRGCVDLVRGSLVELAGSRSNSRLDEVVRSIDHVLPVGGPMALKPMTDALADLFQANPGAVQLLRSVDPSSYGYQEAVGLGAGLLAARTRRRTRRPGANVPGPGVIYRTAGVVPYDISLVSWETGGSVVMAEQTPYTDRAQSATRFFLKEGNERLIIISHRGRGLREATMRYHPVFTDQGKELEIQFMWDTRGLEIAIPELHASLPAVENVDTFEHFVWESLEQFLQVGRGAEQLARELPGRIRQKVALELQAHGLPASALDTLWPQIVAGNADLAEDYRYATDALSRYGDEIREAAHYPWPPRGLDDSDLQQVFDRGYLPARADLARQRGWTDPVIRLSELNFQYPDPGAGGQFTTVDIARYVLDMCTDNGLADPAVTRTAALLDALVASPSPARETELRNQLTLGLIPRMQQAGVVDADMATRLSGAVYSARPVAR